MSNIEHLDLNGNTLTTFLTVLEEMSVSRASKTTGWWSVSGQTFIEN
jgi:hypothetical protein